MIPVPPRGATHRLGKPSNWDEMKRGECRTLPVRKELKADGTYDFVSTWKPTLEELNALADGGVVVLTCAGRQPPVSVGVELTEEHLKMGAGHEEPARQETEGD